MIGREVGTCRDVIGGEMLKWVIFCLLGTWARRAAEEGRKKESKVTKLLYPANLGFWGEKWPSSRGYPGSNRGA